MRVAFALILDISFIGDPHVLSHPSGSYSSSLFCLFTAASLDKVRRIKTRIDMSAHDTSPLIRLRGSSGTLTQSQSSPSAL